MTFHRPLFNVVYSFFLTASKIKSLSLISGIERIQWHWYHKCKGHKIEVMFFCFVFFTWPHIVLVLIVCTRIDNVTLNRQPLALP